MYRKYISPYVQDLSKADPTNESNKYPPFTRGHIHKYHHAKQKGINPSWKPQMQIGGGQRKNGYFQLRVQLE